MSDKELLLDFLVWYKIQPTFIKNTLDASNTIGLYLNDNKICNKNIENDDIKKHVLQNVLGSFRCIDKHCILSTKDCYQAMEQYYNLKLNELLEQLISQQEEIISSPIRFNGVHIQKIKQAFENAGIKTNNSF